MRYRILKNDLGEYKVQRNDYEYADCWYDCKADYILRTYNDAKNFLDELRIKDTWKVAYVTEYIPINRNNNDSDPDFNVEAPEIEFED